MLHRPVSCPELSSAPCARHVIQCCLAPHNHDRGYGRPITFIVLLAYKAEFKSLFRALVGGLAWCGLVRGQSDSAGQTIGGMKIRVNDAIRCHHQ